MSYDSVHKTLTWSQVLVKATEDLEVVGIPEMIMISIPHICIQLITYSIAINQLLA